MGGLIHCPSCDNHVSMEAAFCPHCGLKKPGKALKKQSQSGWKKAGKVLGAAAAIGAGAVIVGKALKKD